MSTTIVVTKTPEGKLEGVGHKCRRALHKFQLWVQKLDAGECFTMEVFLPRNPRFHKLHFVMLAAVHDSQERFNDPEHLRAWLQIGAGYAEFMPGPDGSMMAVPRSIAWGKMGEIEFAEHHEAVKAFLRSERCQAYLWPHLPPFEATEMVEAVLGDIEASRG